MTKNNLKKIVTRIIAGVAIAALVIVNVQIGISDSENSDMSLSELTVSLFTPAIAATGGGGDKIPCHSSGTVNLMKRYTDCSTCQPVKKMRGTGTEGMCTN